MIRFVKGNLFASNAEAIVNTVNCVGVMGRGIALQFKNQYPENFKAYEAACKHGEVVPGKIFVFERNCLIGPKYIINFPTKRHWRGASRMEDIEIGLADLKNTIIANEIDSIAIPPLGSGLGGLDWNAVRTRINAALIGLEGVDIEIYEPDSMPADGKIVRNRKIPNMTAGRAALVGLIRRYQKGLLDPFVTLLEVHKLMYFLQESGELLRLKYVQAPYGPYAENLRHVLNAIEGHLICGYEDGGDQPNKTIELVPGAVDDVEKFLAEQSETRVRMSRVETLIDGFETPFGLELLSTVHWVTKHGANSLTDVISKTYAWNERKKQFTEHQIGLALNRLVQEKWISPMGE
jgi:O-acetyl-ADP-ribose deacetylase (regulator of RNase III)